VHPADGISGERAEIFADLKRRGVELLVFAGGSTNMCVIYKDYGAWQWIEWLLAVILVPNKHRVTM
jgi:hypothetical protein